MTIPRFYGPRVCIVEDQVRLLGDELKDLRDAIRLKKGDRGEVFDGQGSKSLIELIDVTKDEAVGRIKNRLSPADGTFLQISLFQAALKGVALDLVSYELRGKS